MINVSIIDDQLFEGNETFSGQLTLDSIHPNMMLKNLTTEIIIVILDNGEQVINYMVESVWYSYIIRRQMERKTDYLKGS